MGTTCWGSRPAISPLRRARQVLSRMKSIIHVDHNKPSASLYAAPRHSMRPGRCRVEKSLLGSKGVSQIAGVTERVVGCWAGGQREHQRVLALPPAALGPGRRQRQRW
jgi:hypothetical protein